MVDYSKDISKAESLGLIDINIFKDRDREQKQIVLKSYKVPLGLTKGQIYKAKELYNMALKEIYSQSIKPYATFKHGEAVALSSYIGYYKVTNHGVFIVYNKFTMPHDYTWQHSGVREVSTGIQQVSYYMDFDDKGKLDYIATDSNAVLFFTVPTGYSPI